MSNWLIPTGGYGIEDNGNLGTSLGTTVTSGSPGNTKGSTPTELIASTADDWAGFYVSWHTGALYSGGLLDLYVGASSNEELIVENLLKSGGRAATDSFYIPIPIPAGSRISAATQTPNATQANYVCLQGVAHGWGGVLGATIDTMGAATSDSGGANIDPGATANSKTMTPVVMSSSTANDYKAIMPVLQQINGTGGAVSDILLDIMVGASSSEVAIYENIQYRMQSSGDTIGPQTGWLPCSIPAGSRLTIQAQGSLNSGNRSFDAVLYGLV